MQQQDMIDLVVRHLQAEGAGDIDGAVAVYTEDIEHDAVGLPGAPCVGIPAAREFYEWLTAAFRVEGEEERHRYCSGDAMVLEALMTGAVIGEFLGFPGAGQRISFRTMHVFDFRDGLICREQIWLDTATIAAQLAA